MGLASLRSYLLRSTRRGCFLAHSRQVVTLGKAARRAGGIGLPQIEQSCSRFRLGIVVPTRPNTKEEWRIWARDFFCLRRASGLVVESWGAERGFREQIAIW